MKAFDTVPHERLIHKLPGYGISEEISKWIRSFLTGRRQKVVVNGEKSDWGKVTSGIPQGSILGPLMFVLYINDLPNEIESSMLLFADDTKIFREIKSIKDQETLQSDVDAMCDWSSKWLLKYHPDKCKSMRLGLKDKDVFKYMLNGHTLDNTTKEKDKIKTN